MADDFTRRKFAWLDQVSADHDLAPAAFKLCYVLATQFWNRGTGDAWPGQETLGKRAGMSGRYVRSMVDELVGHGHLSVTQGHGPGNTNRYCPVVKDAPPSGMHDVPTGETAELFPESETLASTETAAAPLVDVAEFEAWWQQYPRKVAKQAAQRAYSAARRAGASAADLLAGVMRYGAARTGQDPKYTKHPTTWLNGGCWADEHHATASGDQATARERPRAKSHFERAMGGLTWPK